MSFASVGRSKAGCSFARATAMRCPGPSVEAPKKTRAGEPVMQWAAVTTTRGATSVPVQKEKLSTATTARSELSAAPKRIALCEFPSRSTGEAHTGASVAADATLAIPVRKYRRTGIGTAMLVSNL
jgi:hypothetical protein